MPNFSEVFAAGGIKSVQRGVSGVGVITISQVNPAKSQLRFLGSSESGNGYLSLLSGTQIEVVRGGGSVGVKVSWELTEWF